jgi:hypothetical protein
MSEDKLLAELGDIVDRFVKERVAQGYTLEEALAEIERRGRERYAVMHRNRFKVVSEYSSLQRSRRRPRLRKTPP